jgi:hypothetical protein
MKLIDLGIDRVIALTLLNRGWVMLAGPISLIIIISNLSPSEQGFYYTITSVLGLQVFFELGLGFVVLQTVSHLMSELRIENGHIVGNSKAKGKLGRLLADVLRLYAVISMVFICAVALAGAWFLGTGNSSESVSWKAAWFMLVPIFGMSIVTNVIFNFLEGMGLVQDVALARLAQSLTAMTCLWFALSSEMKLMSLVFMHSANLLIALTWILLRHGQLLSLVYRERDPPGAINWRKEIWPFQWRIAVSWAAGYLGSLAITPIIFNQLGAVAAGRIGLSLTLMGAIAAGAMAWVTTKSPSFGRLAAQRNHVEMQRLFQNAQTRAVGVSLVATSTVVVIVWCLDGLMPEISTRFVSVSALAMLAIATVLNVQVSACAAYLRAFRREPFMAMSITSGAAIAIMTLVLARPFGINGVVIGYGLITVAITFFWCRPIFNHLSNEYTKG